MRIAPITQRLIDQVPALGTRVWSALGAAVPPAFPAAYVLPLAEQALEDMLAGPPRRFTARVGVELMLRHAREAATGGPAHEALEDLREQVLAALVGWRPHPDASPLALAEGRLISLEPAQAVWRDEFTLTFTRYTP